MLPPDGANDENERACDCTDEEKLTVDLPAAETEVVVATTAPALMEEL